MAEWFKVFGLGFFNDKLAAKSAKYGFVSVFLTIVLSFVFFMFGFMAADVVPFSTHYDNAGQYKEFVHNAFSDNGLRVEIQDGLAKCDRVVNTRTNESDREKYAKNGYNLIVDTRKSDTLIEFSQVAIKGDAEISYEEYLNLTDKGKEGYGIETRYTDKVLEITDDKVERYESYLEEISKEGTDSYNSEAATAYKELKEKNLTGEEYGKEIYYLYVKYYFSNVQSVLMSAKAPVLSDYYYLNFILGDHANYLYMLDDICVGSFETDRGIAAVFAGYYKGCAAGVLDENSADAFVKDVFYNSVSYSMSSYFTSAMQMAPGYILIPVLVGFVLFLIIKAAKKQFGNKFSECYKIVNTFAWWSAFVTGLITFILAFFVFARKLYLFMPLIFAIILVLRTAVFYISRSIKEKAEQSELPEEDGGVY